MSGPTPTPEAARYVRWRNIKNAVRGRETEVLDKLGIAWRQGRPHIRCPYPEHEDRNPSWRWDATSARAHCSCSTGASIFDVVGRREGIPFELAKIRVAELLGRKDLIIDRSAPTGLTLQEYADAKGLPIEFLRARGVSQSSYGVYPAAVRTVYYRPNNEPPSIRFRVNPSGDKKRRHYWRRGDKAWLYGAHDAASMREAGYVFLVEGESDTQTLWLHDIPAFGLPGAGAWNEGRDAPLLDGIPIAYAWIEPDQGGELLRNKLSRSSIAPRVRVLRPPPGIKDASALYLADRAGFRDAIKGLKETAEPLPPPSPGAAVGDNIPGADGSDGDETQADTLIRLAKTADLYHALDTTAYADIVVRGHRETWKVRSTGFRRWLVRQYFREKRKAPIKLHEC